MDDGNGNEIDKINKEYIYEYLGIEYAPRSCGFFYNGKCLIRPHNNDYKVCDNTCQFKEPL